jgi:nicotinamidase-related amidase
VYLYKEKAVVFIVDMQERLFKTMNKKDELLKNSLKLLKGCKAFNLSIVATEQYPQGLGPSLPEIRPFLETGKTFSKLSFSGYTPQVSTHLKGLNKKDIILLGIEAHVCVWQTCRDLIQDGYQVFMPMECVSSRSYTHILNALKLMEKIGAYVTNIETILFDLLKTKENPEFRFISELIK